MSVLRHNTVIGQWYRIMWYSNYRRYVAYLKFEKNNKYTMAFNKKVNKDLSIISEDRLRIPNNDILCVEECTEKELKRIQILELSDMFGI